MEWYWVNNIETIDSPALVVYAERVRQNMQAALDMVGDAARLRPHVKTHKSGDVTRLMLAAGISKYKCATISEAELVAQCAAPDVLLAYQPVGPKADRLLQLIQTYPATTFSCLLDSEEAAQQLSAKAEKQGLVVPVFIDVNIGMNRTGILPAAVQDLYNVCLSLEGICVVGIHGYDGHIGDADLAIRTQRADEAYQAFMQAKGALDLEGLTAPELVLGGSPTFGIHAARKEVECSPGTFVYWDWSYSEQHPELPFRPAVLLITRVLSILNDRRFTLDLGHKSVAAENPLYRRVRFLNASGLTVVGQSEEHLVVESEGPHSFRIGDVLYGMPWHVCPTCALYESAVVVEDGKVAGRWKMEGRERRIMI